MSNADPTIRREAQRLLKQLDDNRPRRALDLDALRYLLANVAEPADVDKLIADLIRAAWEWGVSCEIDDVRWGEAGDSHNQGLRDRTQELATRLQAVAFPAPDEPQLINDRVIAAANHLPEQVKELLRAMPSMSMYLTGHQYADGVVRNGMSGEVGRWVSALNAFGPWLRGVLASR